MTSHAASTSLVQKCRKTGTSATCWVTPSIIWNRFADHPPRSRRARLVPEPLAKMSSLFLCCRLPTLPHRPARMATELQKAKGDSIFRAIIRVNCRQLPCQICELQSTALAAASSLNRFEDSYPNAIASDKIRVMAAIARPKPERCYRRAQETCRDNRSKAATAFAAIRSRTCRGRSPAARNRISRHFPASAPCSTGQSDVRASLGNAGTCGSL